MPLSPRTLRPSSTFTPKSISGLALWLDGSDTNSLYTTDAGAVTAVSSPTEISGCVGWWDASDASSITESGGLVSQWNDKSGSARHATATTTARPTTGTRTVGGRNALDFNGTSNVMTLGGTVIPTAATHTVFLVYQLDTASQSRFSTLLSSSPAGDQEMRVVGFGSTAIDFYFNGNLGRFLTTTALGLGPVVFSAREATKSVRSAGAGVFSTGSGDAYAWASNPITLGGRPSSNWMDGLLCEAIIFSSTLSDADTSRVEAYLAQRWGISNVHVPAAAASAPVGAWLDKSGGGRHSVQSTAANRPAYQPSGMNSKPALTFDTTKSLLSSASIADLVGSAAVSPAVTVAFVAFSPSAAAGFSAGSDNAANGRLAFQLPFDTAGNSYFDVAGTGSGRLGPFAITSSSQVQPSVYVLQRNGTSMYVRRNGAVLASKSDALQTFSATSAKLQIGQAVGLTGFQSTLSEFLCYSAGLTSGQVVSIERSLAKKYGITLAPQVSNADAQNWIDRVYANGGTVSSATASAVNTFCNDIDAAGIRDRFYRMGIFAGSNLNAALVPLYRGPSLGGAQYGGTTDTNNAFVGVGTDYAETGANGGLTGNGSTKYLNTGFNVSNLPGASNCHLSAYITGTQNIQSPRALVGVLFNGVTDRYRIYLNSATASTYNLWSELGKANSVTVERANSNGGLMLSSRTSTTLLTIYDDAVAVGTNTTLTAETTGAFPFFVFARGEAGTPSEYYNGRMAAYSIGAGMNDQQAAAFYTAMQTFQTALGRQV